MTSLNMENFPMQSALQNPATRTAMAFVLEVPNRIQRNQNRRHKNLRAIDSDEHDD
jgi:hypothetical protein